MKAFIKKTGSAIRTVFLPFSLSLLLLACGGGGSSSSGGSTGPVNPPPAGASSGSNLTQFAVATDLASGPIVFDKSGNAYLADTRNYVIKKIAADGTISIFAGSVGKRGTQDGTGSGALFYGPAGIAIDSKGNLFVSDTFNCGSPSFCGDVLGPTYFANTIRKITPAGVVTTFAGSSTVNGLQDGIGSNAQFSNPSGLAADNADNIYIADCGNRALRKMTPSAVVTTIATGICVGNWLDARVSASPPVGLAIDLQGNILLTDSTGDVIKKVTPTGTVTILAGSDPHNNTVDGVGAAASFNVPTSIAVDSVGNAYVTEIAGQTVRMVKPDGTVTTLLGKAGVSGNVLGNKPGGLSNPAGIAIDAQGLLTVSVTGMLIKLK